MLPLHDLVVLLSLAAGAAGEGKPAPTQKLRIRYHPAGKALSPIDEPWSLTYEYTVPDHEPAKEWDPKQGVFFIWGDTDFDSYGPRNASLRIHDYVYNQIVPQLVIGNTLAANDDKYNPGWTIFDDWQIQAQYFWQRLPQGPPPSRFPSGLPQSSYRLQPPPAAAAASAATASPHGLGGDIEGPKPPQMSTHCEGNGTIFCALCGDVVPVKPGDLITTVIAYDPSEGAMTASISATTPDNGTRDSRSASSSSSPSSLASRAARTSTITIPRPFPNEPDLYADWAAFFKAAQAKSVGAGVGKGVLHGPDWNIEAGVEDGPTLCSVCPLTIRATPTCNVSSLPLAPWTVDTDFGPPGSKWYANCGQTCLKLPPDGRS